MSIELENTVKRYNGELWVIAKMQMQVSLSAADYEKALEKR